MSIETVVVTGASGYLGSWIVKSALDAGFAVRGTVRDPRDEKKTAHLRELAGSDRLTLHEANLLIPGAFDEVVAGADAVIHSASPFFTQHVEDGYQQLVRPAVEGTQNVLDAVEKTPSVGRVVVTSSVAAIIGDGTEAAEYPGRNVDETRWNHTSSAEYQPYSFSKLAAERRAREIAEAQSRWSLATINPAFIIGPSLSRRLDGTSVALMKQLGDGTFKQGVPDLVFGFVDVRDVALAHVRALEKGDALGRFLLSDRVSSLPDLARLLRGRFGAAYPIPKRAVPKVLFWLLAPSFGLERRYVSHNVGIRFGLDNTRSREVLGIEYRDTQLTAIEHFEQLIENGALPAPAG